MLQPSALSATARQLRSHLAPALGLPVEQILIGHPNAAFKESQGSDAKDMVNLFFYRADHGAYPSASDPRDPLYLRLHCLITAFAASTLGSNGASAGENDLRIVGRVIEVLHAGPMLGLVDAQGHLQARLQIVLVPMSLDDINHLWATQSDTPYRLSVAYELALVPAPLAAPVARAPLVGVAAVALREGQRARRSGLDATAVGGLAVDASDPAWAPQIAWLTDGPRMTAFQAIARDALGTSLPLILVGVVGEAVTAVWSGWSAQTGWHALDDASPQTLACKAAAADAGQGPLPDAVQVQVPATDAAQLQLCFKRSPAVPGGGRAVLSNPLLLSLFDGATP